MSESTLYRIAGVVGLLSAFVLLFNLGRRTGVVPDIEVVRAVAPLAGVFGLFTLGALYLRYARAAGVLGVVGFALNAAGLAGVVGIEYITNYVFPFLPEEQITALVDGFTGTMLLVTSVIFLLGVLLFGAALWRGRQIQPPLAITYGVGFALVALRLAVPEVLYHAGLLIGVAVLAVLAVRLLCDAAPATSAAGGDQRLCVRLGMRHAVELTS